MTLEHDIKIIKEIVDLGWMTKQDAVFLVKSTVGTLLRKYELE